MNPKEMAFAHFEKLILAICLFVFGWFMLGVLSIKPYEKKPSEFNSATQAARQHVTDPNRKLPESESEALAAANYKKKTEELFRDLVPPDWQAFIHNMRWVRPFDYGINFRNEPKILAPGKPLVQQNRGLMQTYQIDVDGNPIMRKVSKRRFAKGSKWTSSKGFQKNFGRGGRGGRGDSSSGMPGAGGMEDMGGGGMEGMGDGGSSSGFGQMMGMTLTGGGGGGFSGGGGLSMGGRGEDEGDDFGGELGGAKEPNAQVPNRILERGKKKVDDTKDEKKKEPEEEEPIESREGYRWVEIVAPFPHSDQIVEFVKALKEGYRTVKLNYATVDVQRREQLPDLSWSEWRGLNIKEQFDIALSALGFERETSPALVQGLAMNVPLLDVYQRVFLHEQQDLYFKAEPAEYLDEHLDPVGYEEQKKEALRRWKLSPQGARGEKMPEAKAEEKEKKHLAERPKASKFGYNDPNKARQGVRPNRYELKTALIRFWDFTVEPGKKYRYRIRVRVFNPNYKREDVAESEFARRITLVGDWSPESDDVFVDFDNKWYYPEQRASRTKSDEVLLEVHHWYRGMGQWLVGMIPQRVGQFIGLGQPNKEIKALKWNDQTYTYDIKKFRNDPEFDSGSILLSFETTGSEEFDFGGRSRTVAVPRAAISVNPLGQLERHDEAVDKLNPTRANIVENYEQVASSIEGDDDKKKEKEKDGGKDPTKGKRGR